MTSPELFPEKQRKEMPNPHGITFYSHYEIGSYRKWSVNLPFVCGKCGKCCKLGDFFSSGKYLTGNPSKEQIEEINNKLTPCREEYNQILSEDKSEDKDKTSAYLENTNCPFLSPNKLCEIYPYRPEGCRAFPKTDFGMDSEPGYCVSLDRFKRCRESLLKGQRWYLGDSFFVSEDGIKPVSMTKSQYDRCVAKLQLQGISEEELEAFAYVNNRNGGELT